MTTESKNVQELELADSCEIRMLRNDGGQVTGVEVVCETPEARAAMATAMSDHEIMVKVRVREEGQTEGQKSV